VIPGADARPEQLEATLADLRESSLLVDARIVVGERDVPFGALLRRALLEHPGCDVACLHAGVRLPFAWDERLAKAAHAEPAIAASVPMCDASPLHRLLDAEHDARAASASDDIDRSAYCMGSRGYYEIPSLHGFCAYLRRDALERALAAVDEDADAGEALAALASRWHAIGRALVLCDFLYVGSAGLAPQPEPAVQSVAVSAFSLHHPLGALRRAVNEALERGLPPVSTPGLDSRPVQLHIMHFWGGGVDKWVRDFARADRARTNLILATYRIGERGGQRIVLYSDADARVPVHTWDIARPLRSTVVASLEYREVLQQIVRELDVEAIIVSSLIGHSLDALAQPMRTVIVGHDFYPLCPNINPRFDERCSRCAPEEFERCLSTSDFRSEFGDAQHAEWGALRDAYVARVLERGIEIVVPSESVARTMTRLEPRLAAASMRVIAHGIDFAVGPLPVPPVDASKPLRLVVVGRMNARKGLELLRTAGKDLGTHAALTLVGCGPEAAATAAQMGWDAIGEYQLQELPGILQSLAPHAAILPSVVAETFSYTLSEMWTLGIPPIATALGAFAERIEDGVSGFLFRPEPEALVALIRDLHASPARLTAVAAHLAANPPSRTATDMVGEYSQLLPQGVRPVARFPVGIGRETALTEPYRRLEEAYSRIAAAYEEVQAAYAHTRVEFERVHACYARAKADLASVQQICDAYGRELDDLHVGMRWWLAPRAERLVAEMRRKIVSAQAATDAATDPKI
jgi:glycosyltransferase involved in cell wall biosynthesis